jgi:uncharacterized protein (TIGR04255 family)
MSVTYKKAPLVELAAELRWSTLGVPPITPSSPPVFHLSMSRPKDDELYMHFGALMSAAGYGRFERVAPPGFPVMPSQVACRFRPTDIEKSAPLFQLGQGIFSANALPPYKSWVDFSPIVRIGIEALLEAHKRTGISAPAFNAVMVRYIDAFLDDLTKGRTVQEFLREVMDLNLVLPKAIVSKAQDAASIQPVLQLVVPTALGRLEMTFAEGRHGNDRAVMLDTSILIQRDFGASAQPVMDALSDGRKIIHDIFIGLTAPIHAAMEPAS